LRRAGNHAPLDAVSEDRARDTDDTDEPAPPRASHVRRKLEMATRAEPPIFAAPPRKLTVAFIHIDTLARATLARRLVQARCDVLVIDDPAALASPVCDVVVCDVTREIGVAVRAMVAMTTIPILAWTNVDPRVVERIFRAAGATRFGMVPKRATVDEILAHVHTLLATVPVAAPQTHKRRILRPEVMLGLERATDEKASGGEPL
jgi:hypothetical protein